MPYRFLSVTLGILLWATTAQPATFHVALSGSDSTPCAAAQSTASPRRTINAGIACLSSGDTLELAGGTYTNECLSDMALGDNVPLPSGSTVRAAAGATVLLHATRQCAGGNAPITLGASHTHGLTIEGIEVTGDGTFQLVVLGPTRNLTLRRMVLSHGREGIAGVCTDCRFEGITTRYMGRNAQMQDVCPVPELGCHGIYMHGPDHDSDPHTTGNVFSGITSHGNTGLGLSFSCEGCGRRIHGNTVVGSLFYGNGSTGLLAYPGNTLDTNIVCRNYAGINVSGSTVRGNRSFANQEVNWQGSGNTMEGNSESGSAAECPTSAPGGGPAPPAPPPPKPPLPAPRNLRVFLVGP